MAVIMGTSRIRAAVVSTNVPAMSRIMLISSSSRVGSSVTRSKAPAMRAGMSSMAAIQLNTDAVAMMNITMEEVIAPSLKIGIRSRIRIFRYTNIPTSSA